MWPTWSSRDERLATITPLKPIEARFSMPVRDAAALRRQRREKDPPPVKPVLHSPDVASSPTGKVDFLGSQVDEDTGTVQARATFRNADGLFLPGQFVRIQLRHLVVRNVLAVPEIAVTQGQGGPQLYVLDKHNRVHPQNVDLGNAFGQWVIVTDGLKPGARVVVNHIASVKAGALIKPRPFNGIAKDGSGTDGEQTKKQDKKKNRKGTQAG